ncbi:hypothetical protein BJ508DRAFT_160735 [Ascobolus immersus RN42]|uniref:Uncharacterized protein n=1 Tax=Ascobolus immersus RN42 TaxID=1160509 RepID=A0A3N4I236_ASCIM|nr:hypothetical protein BJ508DRAFT_160735 [Ascobolus immersus RN42]
MSQSTSNVRRNGTITETFLSFGIEISHSTHMATFNAQNRSFLQAHVSRAPQAEESHITIETLQYPSTPRLQFSHLASLGTSHMASFNAQNRALLQAREEAAHNEEYIRGRRARRAAAQEAAEGLFVERSRPTLRSPNRNTIAEASQPRTYRQHQIQQEIAQLRTEYDELDHTNHHLNLNNLHAEDDTLDYDDPTCDPYYLDFLSRYRPQHGASFSTHPASRHVSRFEREMDRIDGIYLPGPQAGSTLADDEQRAALLEALYGWRG